MDELDKRSIFNLDDVSEIHYDQQEGLILYTRIGGVPVRLGKQGFGTQTESSGDNLQRPGATSSSFKVYRLKRDRPRYREGGCETYGRQRLILRIG